MMLARLLPEEFFTPVATWLLWLLTFGAMGLLVCGADRAVSAAVRLAAALGASTAIIGATVVSLGTTSPEAFVSVNAALHDEPGLALGNGVGSIICNVALIFGLGCLIGPPPPDRFVVRRHGWLQFGAAALLTATVAVLALAAGAAGGFAIPRPVGVLYVLLLVAYLAVSVRWARQHPQAIPPEARVRAGRERSPRRAVRNLGLLAFGLALVIAGSELLIGSVQVLCVRYGVPTSVLAVTVVALGTSLPELATAVASVVKGHAELLLGNVLGANILNVLFVVGVSATAVPLVVDPLFLKLYLPMMLAVLATMQAYGLAGGGVFRRWQGVPLLLAYGAFLTAVVISGAGV